MLQQIDTLTTPLLQADTTALTDTLATTDSCCGAQYCCIYDSLFPMAEAKEPVLHKSLFTHHQLAVQNSHEITIQRQGAPGWFFGFIILSVLLFCLYIKAKQTHLVDLLKSAIDHRALDRMLRDTNLTHALDQAPIALISLIPLSLVCYSFFFSHSSNTLTDILHYLLLLVICYATYYTRNGFIRLIGNAFANPESVHIYLSSNYIYHLLYGIVATVFAFFVCYTGSVGRIFFYILAGIIGLLFVFRLIRGMQIILTLSKTPKFYLFYYLCIFEFVPIVIVTKVVTTL